MPNRVHSEKFFKLKHEIASFQPFAYPHFPNNPFLHARLESLFESAGCSRSRESADADAWQYPIARRGVGGGGGGGEVANHSTLAVYARRGRTNTNLSIHHYRGTLCNDSTREKRNNISHKLSSFQRSKHVRSEHDERVGNSLYRGATGRANSILLPTTRSMKERTIPRALRSWQSVRHHIDPIAGLVCATQTQLLADNKENFEFEVAIVQCSRNAQLYTHCTLHVRWECLLPQRLCERLWWLLAFHAFCHRQSQK